MEVITIDSKAFHQLEEKITTIYEHIVSLQSVPVDEDKMWVNSGTLCRYLQISERTLQRLRTGGHISYSPMGGKYFYQISQIRKMLESNLIKSTKECLNELVSSQVSHYHKALQGGGK